jgi:hypothetical protein
MYAIVQGTKVYERALNTNNTRMYMIVQGEPMYAKKNMDWVNTRPRNLDINQCRCCQATRDTKNHANREQLKRKTTN